ncbi:hypothetical protein M1271_00680 [Patescibacteria group bacterium]|nr:hypothetical protein [Patescibacteria group bacterium]MCL5797536.1 hypothetical protein [Patescibacteria group bacterium]
MRFRLTTIFISIFTVSVLFFIRAGYVKSASPTPTDVSPSPNSDSVADTISSDSANLLDKLKKIEILKDKIATKVAQLRANEKGGVTGTVKSISDTTITVKTDKGDFPVSYASDATFYDLTTSAQDNQISIKKISVGDEITALGYFDDTKSTLSGKYIYIETSGVHSVGKIADIDKSNYTVTIKEPEGNITVDIETYTKIYSYTPDKGFIKSGFSKLQIGDIAQTVGTPNAKEQNRMSAIRMITISLPTTQISTTPQTSPSPTPTQTPKKK